MCLVSVCSFTHNLILFIGIIYFGFHFQLFVRTSVNHASILQSFLILCFWGWSQMGGHAWGFIFHAGLSLFIYMSGKGW